MTSSSAFADPTPRVGVMVISHESHYLQECIESVLSQSFRPDRIVVIDNGSPADASVSAVALAYELDLIRIEKPMSASTARNVGCVFLDDCEYIVNLDGDDVWLPEYLETYLGTAREERADVVFGAAEVFGVEQGVWFTAADRPESMDLRRGNFVPANSLFRRDLWWRVGGFDPALTYFEDWDFWLSCAERSAVFRSVEQPLWRYRRHARSLMGASTHSSRDGARQYVREKHLRFIQGRLGWRRWKRNFEKYLLRRR
ncbi:MAG: glycosyltransferase family A protein [Actinomycetota bacterium]|nr:glycosyltransferase family A protein [Actinomycetota bacterium]